MKVKQLLVVAAAVTAIGVTGVMGANAVSAQSTTSNDSLIDKIASKFNVNKDDVKAVFDEDKAAREAEHQAEISDRLQTAVDKGNLTAEQKTLIENKLKEVHDAREAKRTELDAWAQQNGIDVKYLMMGHHGDDTRLQDAVDSGSITAEQKSLIEQKQAELQNEREVAKDELDQWAQDNNIDTKYIMMGGHGGHGRGMDNR